MSMLAHELQSTNDSTIIADQTAELQKLAGVYDEKKEKIILQAADLLAQKYTADPTKISARLKRVWREVNISPKYIERSLPDKYKRFYSKPEPVIEPTDVQLVEKIQSRLAHNLQKLSRKILALDVNSELITILGSHHGITQLEKADEKATFRLVANNRKLMTLLYPKKEKKRL